MYMDVLGNFSFKFKVRSIARVDISVLVLVLVHCSNTMFVLVLLVFLLRATRRDDQEPTAVEPPQETHRPPDPGPRPVDPDAAQQGRQFGWIELDVKVTSYRLSWVLMSQVNLMLR